MRGLPTPAGGRQGAFRAGGRESDPRDMEVRDDPDTLNALPGYLKTPFQRPRLHDFAQVRSRS